MKEKFKTLNMFKFKKKKNSKLHIKIVQIFIWSAIWWVLSFLYFFNKKKWKNLFGIDKKDIKKGIYDFKSFMYNIFKKDKKGKK